MCTSNFTIEENTSTYVIIRDQNKGKSVTNDAENVVHSLASLIKSKRLFYYDSMGHLDELVHENGEFVGFAPLNILHKD